MARGFLNWKKSGIAARVGRHERKCGAKRFTLGFEPEPRPKAYPAPRHKKMDFIKKRVKNRRIQKGKCEFCLFMRFPLANANYAFFWGARAKKYYCCGVLRKHVRVTERNGPHSLSVASGGRG